MNMKFDHKKCPHNITLSGTCAWNHPEATLLLEEVKNIFKGKS